MIFLDCPTSIPNVLSPKKNRNDLKRLRAFYKGTSKNCDRAVKHLEEFLEVSMTTLFAPCEHAKPMKRFRSSGK